MVEQPDLFRRSPSENGGTNDGNPPPFFSDPLKENQTTEASAIRRQERRRMAETSRSPVELPNRGSVVSAVAAMRNELAFLANRKVELMPSVDAYWAERGVVISALEKLHGRTQDRIGVAIFKGQPGNARVIELHDEILKISEKYGQQIGEYKDLKGAMKRIENEIERIEKKETDR